MSKNKSKQPKEQESRQRLINFTPRANDAIERAHDLILELEGADLSAVQIVNRLVVLGETLLNDKVSAA